MFRRPRLLVLICLALTALAPPRTTRAQSVFGDLRPTSARGPAVRASAELLLNTDRLAPGQQAIAAVVVTTADGYHAQSNQPLDPTLIPFVVTLKSEPVAAVQVGEALYPPATVVDFPALGGKLSVFEGRVVTFVPFTVPSDAAAGEATLTASVRFQACNDSTCDPPKTITATAKTSLAVDGAKPTSTHADVFSSFDPNRWMHVHPTDAQAATQPALSVAPAAGLWTPFSDAALAAARAGGKPVIIDFTAAWCVNCHVVERLVYGDALTVDRLRERGVTLMRADLTQDGAPGSDLLAKLNAARSIPFTAIYFLKVDAPAGLTGIYSSRDLFATLDDAGRTATSATTIAGFDLATAPLALKLLVAVGVGVLLNAVPCVLPVLPLKAMSFYEDAGHSRARSMLNGGLFSLGIVATFGGLALFVISQDALWGKFISSPITAGILTVVLLGAAAQAFGLFEFALPRFVTNLEAKTSGPLDYGHDDAPRSSTMLSHAKNFFSGMLIAVLSTPCTIGVFAAVIAVAITAGSVLGSLILMCVGVGMALPWFALSGFPEVTQRFPRTGPWPGVVKQMTGFLLVATAIFFAAPLMPAAFRDHVLWWLIFACVALAAVFLLARTVQLAPRVRPLVISGCVSALLIAGGLSLALAMVG